MIRLIVRRNQNLLWLLMGAALAALLITPQGLLETPARSRSLNEAKERSRLELSARASGLFPGARQKLRISIKNTARKPIRVEQVRVRVRPDADRPSCPPDSYIKVGKSRRAVKVGSDRTRRVKVRISMSPDAPDECQGASFPLRLWAEGSP